MRQARQIGIELELAPFVQGAAIVAGRFMEACKAKPLVMNRHLIHRDASMVELAMAPASCPRELAHNYMDAMTQVQGILPDGVELLSLPAVEYSKDELDSDPYASVMGCSESGNIYGAPKLSGGYTDNVRYGGMHVNIEIDEPTTDDVLALDAVLGLYSVVYWEQPNREAIIKRRTNYGRAGEFRIKDFGLEYRTLPNCAFDPINTEIIWNLVNTALSLTPEQINMIDDNYVQLEQAIQQCDAELAIRLMELWDL